MNIVIFFLLFLSIQDVYYPDIQNCINTFIFFYFFFQFSLVYGMRSVSKPIYFPQIAGSESLLFIKESFSFALICNILNIIEICKT